MRIARILLLLALSSAWFQAVEAAVPQTINYQGVLTDLSGVPLEGDHLLTFRIYLTEDAETHEWTETDSVEVVHGVFNAILGDQNPLDLPFDRTYWLGTSVDGGEELSPRSQLTASPYSLRSRTADHAVIADSAVVSGYDGETDGDWIIIGDNMCAGVSGNIGIGTSQPAVQLDICHAENEGGAVRISDPSGSIAVLGDGGTSDDAGILKLFEGPTEKVRLFAYSGGPSWHSAGNFGFGTTDPTSRLEVFDANGNNLTLDAAENDAATIRMKGRYEDEWTTVGGGSGGAFTIDTPRSFVISQSSGRNIKCGFSSNHLADNVIAATISGGGITNYINRVTDNYGTIGGGIGNRAGDQSGGIMNKPAATVAGGGYNIASGAHSSVGGGESNEASGDGATVSGGLGNAAVGNYATVCGGTLNNASGLYSTVAGGKENGATGSCSFAAGYEAHANADGSFVWSDATVGNVLVCNVANRWKARASGGVYFYTNGNQTTGVFVAAGGRSWNEISDRATQEDFRSVDGEALLARLDAMPIREYKLKSQDASIRHIGPVAQDMYGAFGYGESDRAINMGDADGVSLAAIQSLYRMVKEMGRQIAEQQREIERLRTTAWGQR